MTVVNYRIQKTISLQTASYINDITYFKEHPYVPAEIGISVANTYNDYYDVISTNRHYVSIKGLFVEYSPYMGILYGNGNKIVLHRQGYENNVVVWSLKTQGSSLYAGFSAQGITVCKSGEILISLWNKEIGDRSIGKVLALTWDFKMIEGFQIFMERNRPLLVCPTYLKENGNGDICVSDVGAVVVTDAAAMLRFRYQGSSRNSNFEPYGLCCDSACNIIIAGMKSEKIHVIDKDGRFLYYARYEGIKMPPALCIDEKDNLYVGEWNSSSIKVISR